MLDKSDKFGSGEMWVLGNQFGINSEYTAAYGPWEKRLNKCNHAADDIMMEKC